MTDDLCTRIAKTLYDQEPMIWQSKIVPWGEVSDERRDGLIQTADAVIRELGLSVQRVGYVGWVEFASCTATTHIAHLYEDGSIYLPEGLDVVSEFDLRHADATNRMWPLIRAFWKGIE